MHTIVLLNLIKSPLKLRLAAKHVFKLFQILPNVLDGIRTLRLLRSHLSFAGVGGSFDGGFPSLCWVLMQKA